LTGANFRIGRRLASLDRSEMGYGARRDGCRHQPPRAKQSRMLNEHLQASPV
jgi:hypothetical protein